jgi:type VI secretion system protein ImpK
MANEAAVRATAPRSRDEAVPAHGGLAILYDAILTSIVRLQSARQHITDAESFRRRIKATLQEIEQLAVPAGYDGRDLRDAHFAVVALLDSVILHSNDPIRKEWEKKLFQEELFGQTDAGVAFFEKLANFQSRRDSDQLANILEVYLLCLLLGFEGRYSGGLRAELETIAERARHRIDNIRGRSRPLSPQALPVLQQTAEEVPLPQAVDRLRWIVFAALAITVACFIVFKINLSWTAEQLRSQLP